MTPRGLYRCHKPHVLHALYVPTAQAQLLTQSPWSGLQVGDVCWCRSRCLPHNSRCSVHEAHQQSDSASPQSRRRGSNASIAASLLMPWVVYWPRHGQYTERKAVQERLSVLSIRDALQELQGGLSSGITGALGRSSLPSSSRPETSSRTQAPAPQTRPRLRGPRGSPRASRRVGRSQAGPDESAWAPRG